MLTKEQLNKLNKLTTHPKYGPVLKAAIIGWKRCRSLIGYFGVAIVDGKFRRSSDGGCCFLGAVVLNRKQKYSGFVIDNVKDRYGLTVNETWSLSDGFENEEDLNNYVGEAYRFGQKVRKALGI